MCRNGKFVGHFLRIVAASANVYSEPGVWSHSISDGGRSADIPVRSNYRTPARLLRTGMSALRHARPPSLTDYRLSVGSDFVGTFPPSLPLNVNSAIPDLSSSPRPSATMRSYC